MLALKHNYKQLHNEKARHDVIKPGDFYMVQNHKTPQANQIPLKYQPRYLPQIFLCKKVSGKNVLGIDIILGSAMYSSIDHVKIYKAREEYFSDLPDPIKKHFGSSLDLKLSLDARKVILEKLQKLGMYQEILKPAETLSSPAPISSSASGTLNLAMITNHSLSEKSSNKSNERGTMVRQHTSQPNATSEEPNIENNNIDPGITSSPQEPSPAKDSPKETILKKLGRARKYLNPFAPPPPPPRKRKRPARFS